MSALSPANAALIEDLLQTWASIRALLATLTDEQLHLPTDLPGWSVRDVIAHMASVEAHLLEHPEPDHAVSDAGHVKNLLGAWNEQRVDHRRSWAVAQVVSEFDAVTRAREPVLRALDDDRLSTVEATPLGEMPLQRFVQTRFLDSWVHEQDIRLAVGVPETVGSAATSRVLDIAMSWLPRAVAKARVQEGAAAVVDVLAPQRRTVAALVQEGRGVACDPRTASVLRISANPAPLLRVALGRREPDAAIAAGEIQVDGDTQLAARLLEHLNRMP